MLELLCLCVFLWVCAIYYKCFSYKIFCLGLSDYDDDYDKQTKNNDKDKHKKDSLDKEHHNKDNHN